jgi:hypothetical protein
VLLELLRAEGGVVATRQLLEKAWDEQIDPFTNVALNHHESAPQARRTRGDRNTGRYGMPHPMNAAIRTRLTLPASAPQANRCFQ